MVKRIITFFFLLIALTALTLLITLIPEILGAELTSEKGQGFLLVVFGKNYAWWLLLILVVAIAVLFFFTPEQIKALFKQGEKPIALTPEETQKNYDTIRQYLHQRYERRKDQKLAGDQLFNLRIKSTTEGTTPEKAETFVTLQGRKTGEEIQQIFEKARSRLLVTGLPGAGKTSLLLNLALELLETDHENLAVLLNLATWRSDFPSFDDWLREILPAELGVTKRYAADILQAGKLTLLLDGLDEVDEAHRTSCLKAIGEYGRLGRDYVISTRKNEYKALEKDAPVWAQIEVLPLTDKQLVAQLDQADRRDFPEAPALKAALEQDPLLLRVAETQFYLNCLQLLFRGGNTLSELNFKGATVAERQVEITERFVEQALAQPSKYGSSEQVRHWLAFLASRMTQRNKVVFELVDLQCDWCKLSKLSKSFAWLTFIIVNSIFITIFLLSTIFATIWQTGLIVIIFLTLTFIWIMLLMILITAKNRMDKIRKLKGIIYGDKKGELKKLFFELKNEIHARFIIATKMPQIETKDSLNWQLNKLLHDPFLELFIMIFFGILFRMIVLPNVKFYLGILIGFIFFILGRISNLTLQMYRNYSTFLQITTPYQRFTASAKALHFSILQHWLLRWQLHRAGVLPLRLVHFLNEMTTRHLLETDGATWRFRHRILQEYFAKQWKEKDDEKP